MFNEFICIFRRYCNMTREDMALAARIPLKEYNEYEQGLKDPDAEILKRFAKIFGLEESVFNLGYQPFQKTIDMFEVPAPDETIFATAEDKEKVKLLVNLLSDDECRLLLLFRTASEKNKISIMNTAIKSIENIDSVEEENLLEYLLTLEGSYAEKTQELAEQYSIPHEEANDKIKNVFLSQEWKDIKAEIENTVNEKLLELIEKEFNEEA